MRYGGTPELSIVIPTVDVLSVRVRECVDAVRSNTDAEHEIVLVENRSPPQGYTAPVNAGIRGAQGQYVVVLNDDVQMMEGWWPPMRKALDEGALVSFADFGGFPRSDLFAAPCIALSREALVEVKRGRGAGGMSGLQAEETAAEYIGRFAEVEKQLAVGGQRFDLKVTFRA